ncbi:MAG: competence/damage-inducible protein A [Nitrospirae bacterium]|nr:competence/damage-inducible protein A [Nitrospirota bacterium]
MNGVKGDSEDMNKTNAATVGIIIIGNEILSGKVQDVNSHYLAAELRGAGADVRRISVIPDSVSEIGDESRLFSGLYDYVITTGGVGPTHDDVTMEGIAKGFGAGLVRHPLILEVLSSLYEPVNDAVLKMADVPDGSEIIFRSGMRFPVVRFRNIFVFPGIPEYLRKKFPLVKEHFVSSPIYLKKIYLKVRESDVAPALSRVSAENPAIDIGSYPVLNNEEFNLLITLESRQKDLLDAAFRSLKGLLPAQRVVRTEE